MTCEDCGLPGNRQYHCDRWKCTYTVSVQDKPGTYVVLTGRTVEKIRAVLAGAVGANSATRVFGVVARGRDDLSANLDAVPRLRWVFGVPDALRGFHYDILRASGADRDT